MKRQELTTKKNEAVNEMKMELSQMKYKYDSKMKVAKERMHEFYNKEVQEYNLQHSQELKAIDMHYDDIFIQDKNKIIEEFNDLKKQELNNVKDYKKQLLDKVLLD